MTATAQDFTLYVGDNAAPQFAVVDGAGAIINIAAVRDIFWAARRSPADPIVVSKLKSLGGISFVTDGTDGKFQLVIVPAVVAGLSGFYLHFAQVTDNNNFVTTVTLGRLNIVPTAPSSWTYSGDPSVSLKDEVRFLIGDTDESDPQQTDAEINYAIANYGGFALGAAVFCCLALATKYGRFVSKSVGDLRISYSDRTKQYRDLAAKYQAEAAGSCGVQVYGGGQSISDKQTVELDTDRVPPKFKIGQMDNPNPPDSIQSYDEIEYGGGT